MTLPTTADPTAPRDRLAEHLPDLRAMLVHQRRFRLAQLAEIDAVVDDTRQGMGHTDGGAVVGTTVADRARHEIAVKVADAARKALADIDIALTLVTDGSYGRCRRRRSRQPFIS
jgi:RNA polymerase-binding transcription factor DksA